MRCLIVDDEPLASDVIENYINKIESLNIVAKCNSALQAINVLKEHQIDLIFLFDGFAERMSLSISLIPSL